jgi:YVTN family beta-propeller protein
LSGTDRLAIGAADRPDQVSAGSSGRPTDYRRSARPTLSVPTDLPIGTELLGYRIEAELGHGGMGIVYLAEDLRLKRPVALKLVSPELAEDEGFRERLLAESELAASLDHPNIVPIYAAGEAGGHLFIAMRYVEGTDLRKLLRQGPFEPERSLRLCSQVADALDFAHARGLVHRDVKPSNVLLDEREHVYLADFGLTKRLSDTVGDDFGLSLGTPDYAAPEQIRGERVAGRADVYSLGCLLYECLAGTPPYAHDSDAAVLFAHLRDDPPSLPGLERVFAKALAKSPDERYGSCRELIEEASAALGLGAARRRRLPLLVAGVGIALVAAAVLAFALLQGGSSPPIRATGNDVAAIDPSSNRVVATVAVGTSPQGIAFTAGSLWVANVDDRTVSRVDPVTGRVINTLPVGYRPAGLGATSRTVWVAGPGPSEPLSFLLSRIDPELDTVAKPTQVSGALDPESAGTSPSNPIATRRNVVWVAPASGLLSRLDPEGRRVGLAIDPGAFPANIVVGADAVWITDPNADTVTRVDPASGELATIPVGHGPDGITFGAGSIWVADSDGDAVTRIDPRTRGVTETIPVGHAPFGIAFGAGSVWVANSRDGTVTRIDPADGAVLQTIQVGGNPQQILVAGGRVWVTVQ